MQDVLEIEQGADRLLPTYRRANVTFERGKGAYLFDDRSREFLDFSSGVAVTGLGHLHPRVVAAAEAQMRQVWHVSNHYWSTPMIALATRLSKRFGGGRCFLCNSGTEANEAALKFARKATGRPNIVALENSFHGRTFGSLSITGQSSKRAGFGPLLPGVRFIALNDFDGLEKAIDDSVGSVIMEPIQGEGGVRPAAAGFVQRAAKLAKQHGAIFCLDEIQTGVGRTGTFFAFERFGIRPDLVTLAKGLANGLPIGCLIVADGTDEAFAPGDHATTFGGNPVTCAAAAAVVDEITDDLLANVRRSGEAIAHSAAHLPAVTEVRGSGLLIGLELDRPAVSAVQKCFEHRLLVTAAGERVLRLTPPLIIGRAEIERAVETLSNVLK